jgi:hypothetical protein
MKKLIYLTIVLLTCLASACKKEAQVTKLASVSFGSDITASKTAVTLTPAADTASVVSFSWPAVAYPVKATVTYTLQVDVPADTVGTGAWGGATNVEVGKDVLSKSYKGKDLNTMAIAMGIKPGETGSLIFRVRAYQDQYAYTKPVVVAVTPYQTVAVYPLLYVPGDYQGWSPGTAPTVAALKPNIYEGYIYIPASSTREYKFTTARDWNHINYGDAGANQLTTDGLKGGMVAPAPGYVQVSANLITNSWSATPTTWGIIGGATPHGWDSDTKMTYNPTTQVWTVTADMIANGSFKFRANGAWVIDFGIDANGKLAYADNPVYGYDSTVKELTVPSDGNYTITLDLHEAGNYRYTLKKN